MQSRTKFLLYGLDPSYKNFIQFVKDELAPYMTSKFIEEDYYKTIYNEIWKNRHNLYQIARGHSKTELVGIWVTIFIAICQPVNPFFTIYEKRITEQMLIAGDKTAMANWTERIKHFFYNNETLRQYIPDGIAIKKQNIYWNQSVMYLKNGSKILLRSIGDTAIRGNHVDRLHADDLVTENSTLIDQKIINKWNGAVDGTTTNKQAMVQVTGTPLRYSDILFELEKNGYNFIKLPAIINEDTKKILSPKRWTYKDLMITKKRIGSVKFQSEYMLNPISDEDSLIKSHWITQCYDSKRGLEYKRPEHVKNVYMGVDFAFSDRVTADKSAFVIIGEQETYDKLTNQYHTKWIILDILTKKGLSGLEQFDYMKQLHEYYKFDEIAVEENSIKAISKSISSFNLPIKRYWMGSRDERKEDGMIKDYETIGKRNLILRIANQLEQKNVIIPYNTTAMKKADELYKELITFAQEDGKVVEIGVHSDIGIAFGLALEVAVRWAGSYFLTE